jgi:hypothetical protein
MQANEERAAIRRGVGWSTWRPAPPWPMTWPMIYLDLTDSRLPGTRAELRSVTGRLGLSDPLCPRNRRSQSKARPASPSRRWTTGGCRGKFPSPGLLAMYHRLTVMRLYLRRWSSP